MSEENNISGIDSKELIQESITTQHPKSFLFNKKIAISVSNSENLIEFGLDEQHLNDISIELARYVIANSGTALYGGDLRVNGFTKYFEELVSQYTRYDDDNNAFENYFAAPFLSKIDKNLEREFKSKKIGIKKIDAPSNITFDNKKNYQPTENNHDRYVYSECFRVLREQMTKDCDAKVIIGGRYSNYLGYIPGVLEEAIYQIKMQKPIYIIGGFGGIANELSKLILGQESIYLTNEYQYNNTFLTEYKEYIEKMYNYHDYTEIRNIFTNFNLNALCSNNQLTEVENLKLFKSKNIHEITYLIMKGMNLVFK